MTTETPPRPSDVWARAVRTWLDGWAALFGQGRRGDGTPADPFQLWQRAYDQWLEGWSVFFDQTLSTPEAAAASGRLLDAWLNIEKPLRERTAARMQYWLEFWNLPSRHDTIRLAAQLNDANLRLDELQVMVETLQDELRALAARGDRAAAPVPTGDD
jgi:hypothetical protein